jgi:CRP-like cAMP-binding protein
MARTDSTQQLQKVPLFRRLSNRELKLLANLVREQRYAPGSVIVKEGASGQGLYIVKEGAVSVRKGGRRVARLGAGEFFGEMSILDSGPRTASVEADTETVCLTLASWEIKPLLMDHASITYKMLLEVVRRVRRDSRDVAQ